MEKNAAKNHRFLDFPFVQLQLRCKRVPHRIACTPIPAAAPAYRAKTFSSRAVQGKCFTSYILLYSAARRAAPIYHSPPENATRSRVPRLNAPMGTPRPHVSRHVSGRAPRRGRRPRRPVSAHPRIPAHSRLSLRRGRRPRRPVFCSPIAGCTRVLHVCLRWPYFFQQRKKYGKERRQKPTVFGFPFRPIVTAVQKGSAPNRLHSYPRCRSCVRRLNAPNGHTPPTRISPCLRSRTP